MNIFEKVKAAVIDNASCDESLVTESASLADDLGADSLVAVEIIMALEDEFSISIPAEATKDVKTVGDLVSLVKSLTMNNTTNG